jgi:hypothetical protein
LAKWALEKLKIREKEAFFSLCSFQAEFEAWRIQRGYGQTLDAK